MEMKGLNHVNIGVSDLEKSKKFYCEVFGMAEVYREPHLIFLICGRDILTLQDNYNQKTTEGMHFGFDVNSEDEINKWKDWLKEKNISIVNERGDEGGAGIYFHDPDGNTIEIYFVECN